MKKHLKALLAGAVVAGSILACTAAYARFSDSVTVTNHISVGDINISLRELEKKDGREMKYQDRRIVLPGDEISKIPRITNHSEPCWVRVKISYTDDLEGLDGLDDRNLTGMSPRWIRKGEYFYYTRKLEQGDSVDIFTGVTVPSQWDESYQEKKLGITMNDKKLYSGDLLAVSLNKAVSLGKFSSGEKGNMRFEVTVPAELDNLYALRAADVKWIFSVEEDQETADTSPVPRRNGRKEATERASGNNSSSVRTTPVKTGDESPVILFALMAGMALLTCSLTLWKGGQKN